MQVIQTMATFHWYYGEDAREEDDLDGCEWNFGGQLNADHFVEIMFGCLLPLPANKIA
jgi:hypothetical protein